MGTYTGPAAAAVEQLLADYQIKADQEKTLAPRREAARQRIVELMDELAGMSRFDAAKAGPEMLGAFLIYDRGVKARLQAGDPSVQLEISKFDDRLLNDLRQYFTSLRTDPAQSMNIQREAQKFGRALIPPQVEVGMPIIDVAVQEPEDATGTWTLAVVPVIVGKDYVARMADKLDFDLYISAMVTPLSGLTATFNAPGMALRAGQDVTPFVISHTTTDVNQQTVVHFSAAAYQDGSMVHPVDIPPYELTKRGGGPGLDIAALMKTMGAGPGRHGPN